MNLSNGFCLALAADLEYDSDPDDDIFGDNLPKAKATPAKPAAAAKPRAPDAFIPKPQMYGGDARYRMTLPLLQFPYKDENNIDRYCSIVQMPSGCAEKGVVDFKITNGMVLLEWNATNLIIYNPEQYANFFRHPNNVPIYPSRDHVKIHGHHTAVQKLKGNHKTNRIIFTFHFKPDTVIEGNKVFAETLEDGKTIPGFQLIKATQGEYPQIFAHFEFKQKADGHAFAQPTVDEDHLTGNEDDNSSDEKSASDASPSEHHSWWNKL